MTDDGQAGQVSASAQSPTSQTANGQEPPTSPTTNDPAQEPTSASGEEQLTPEQLRAALDKARKEAARHRVDAKELADLRTLKTQVEDERRKAEEAKLSETDRLKKQLADLHAKAEEARQATQERLLRAEVRAAAAALNVNPALAARIVNLASIEYDEQGDAKNVADLLRAALTEYGIPVGAQGAQNAGQQGQQQPAQTPNPGATNPTTTHGGVPIVTANQYSDPEFKARFKAQYGMTPEKAVLSGKATLV